MVLTRDIAVKTPTSPSPYFVNATTAAKRLGISRPTLTRACERGEVPHRRIGRQFLIPLAFLECGDAAEESQQ